MGMGMSESKAVKLAVGNSKKLKDLRDKHYAGDIDWDDAVAKITAIILTSAGISGTEEVRKFRAWVMAINFLDPGAEYLR
jgi:hypothetical protein